MPLSEQQKRELQRMLGPIIQHALSDEVGPIVRAELERHAAKGAGGTDYISRILASGSAGTIPRKRGTGNLAETARVFARLGMIAALTKEPAQAAHMANVLDVEAEYKAAQSAGSGAGGGLLIASEMSDDIIELLRPFSVMRRIGAMEVPLPAGNVTTPKITSGATSGYVAEGANIPTASLKTGDVSLLARKLATIVVLTNELARFSQSPGSFDADQLILADMLASIGTTEDKAFLAGSGVIEPRGIVNWAAAANKFNATQAGADATLTEVRNDLRDAEELLLSADVPMLRPVWIMSPRSRLFLRDVRDTEDRTVFGTEMAQSGTINGYPFFQTNNIPNNLGAGSNESFVILIDARQVMLGDVAQVMIDRSDSATLNIDGTDTNLFAADLNALRVRRWNDLALRHDVAAAVIEQVKWGA